MIEDELEILERYLDGALPAAEAAALSGRLAGDAALLANLDQLRGERALRVSAFESMEADDATADRLLAGVSTIREPPAKQIPWVKSLRYVTAVAACLAIGFVAGRLMDLPRPTLSPRAALQSYQVAITDDAGRVIAVQKFESLEQATEFSEDLRRWQERQERVRNGQVTIRSARF